MFGLIDRYIDHTRYQAVVGFDSSLVLLPLLTEKMMLCEEGWPLDSWLIFSLCGLIIWLLAAVGLDSSLPSLFFKISFLSLCSLIATDILIYKYIDILIYWCPYMRLSSSWIWLLLDLARPLHWDPLQLLHLLPVGRLHLHRWFIYLSTLTYL